jgi:energy-coupling factor transport system substrate-specific component
VTAASSTHARPDRPAWRTVDVVVAATIAVASGVVFWAWGLLWNATGPAFVAFPPAQAFMYGVWLLPGVLAMLVVRKPGAAVFGALVAAAVSWLLGSWWGLSVVWYGLLQGLAPEAVFAATRYRRFGLPTAVLAGAAAGLVPAVLDKIFFYPEWSSAWTLTYGAVVVASSAAIAGAGGWALTRALAGTGVLDAFPSGSERTRV